MAKNTLILKTTKNISNFSWLWRAASRVTLKTYYNFRKVRKVNVAINPFRAAFFFFERKQLFTLKLMKIAYVSWSGKSTRWSTLSELQFFFWEEATLRTEIDEDCVRFMVWKVNVAINPFRAAVFFIAHVSFSEKMKGECIRIYIVVVARTDYTWLFTTWIDI